MPITVGDQIGDYEITGTLGVGGMGQVYPKVRHTISNRTEAMKILAPGRAISDELKSPRFLRGNPAARQPPPPQYHRELHTVAFRHNGELIMIMEFVDGHTLSAKLRNAPITLANGLDYIQQVLLQALATTLTSAASVHRDVKPSNIMSQLALTTGLNFDFGLAFPTLWPRVHTIGH